ncbi:hypothetical protein PIB30_077756, partial [Stylosanthes scabra]|nr:hypothetical protein [Stylosanthes scabra]
FLGIEKSIGKAKEGIGSKGFTMRKPREENRAPCSRTVPSCVRTCPWECFVKKSVQTCAIARCTRPSPLKAQFGLYEEGT